MTTDYSYFRRLLRKNQTDEEKRLWRYLRTKQLEGLEFRRQEQIGEAVQSGDKMLNVHFCAY